MNRTILVVEDDAALAGEIAHTLARYGMTAVHAADWESALALMDSAAPDLVILDQWLGDRDTLASLPELRQRSTVPIVVLTGNRSEVDRIVGLELGADDFLLKPISGRELVARIRARLRVAPDHPAAPSAPQGDWVVSETDRRVFRPDGSALALTSAEFELLALLARKPGTVHDRDSLTRTVLRRPYRPEDRSIDNLVSQVRQKIGPEGENVISTMRGVGYTFTRFPAR